MLTLIPLLASPMLIGLKEISVWIQDLIDESQGPTYDCDFPQKIHMAKTVSNWSEMKPCGQTTMKKLYHSQTLYMQETQTSQATLCLFKLSENYNNLVDGDAVKDAKVESKSKL